VVIVPVLLGSGERLFEDLDGIQDGFGTIEFVAFAGGRARTAPAGRVRDLSTLFRLECDGNTTGAEGRNAMDDATLLERVTALADEEHRIFEKEAGT